MSAGERCYLAGKQHTDVLMFELNSTPPQIIIVDNFYANPLAVRQFALTQTFVAHEAYHKGKRTETKHLTPELKAAFEAYLGRPITGWEDYAYNGVFQSCVAGEQLVYHSDAQSYAATIYLTPNAPASAGLKTLQSKETKIRRDPSPADAATASSDLNTLRVRTYGNKLLDYSAWDTVDQIGNVFNRLVIFDAKLIHAAGGYFGHDLHSGRLFQMFFFDVAR